MHYPQCYIPPGDIGMRFLTDDQHDQRTRQGTAHRHSLSAGSVERHGAVRVSGEDAIAGVAGTARFGWGALDAWYEEDEQVFVHPRNPYVRVDALRSHRHVRASLDGVTLAESTAPVLVFETGLPARYYFDRTGVVFQHLVHSGTRTACPYKGRTSDCWPVRMRSRRNQCGSAMDCSATPAVHAQPRPMPGAAPGDYGGMPAFRTWAHEELARSWDKLSGWIDPSITKWRLPAWRPAR